MPALAPDAGLGTAEVRAGTAGTGSVAQPVEREPASSPDSTRPAPSSVPVSPAAEPPTFRSGRDREHVPSGKHARVTANLAALGVADRLDVEQRPATTTELAVLARWSGWGAVPEVFEQPPRAEWTTAAAEVAARLTGDGWRAARASTINAHYTSATVAGAMWDTATALGFTGGRVLEPGCGSGNFFAAGPAALPDPVEFVGVERDPTTARICGHLHPHATIHTGAFEDTVLADGSFDLVIGNVPFADVTPHDPIHNKAGWALHNYFIAKSMALCRPNGIVAVVTSRYTLDSIDTRFRSWLADQAELVGAVRLPRTAFQAVAGTNAICDILILRKHDPFARTTAFTETEPGWIGTGRLHRQPDSGVDVGEPATVNEWFLADPDRRVAGTLGLGRGQYRPNDVTVTATEPLNIVLPNLLQQQVTEHHATLPPSAPEPPVGGLPENGGPVPSRTAPGSVSTPPPHRYSEPVPVIGDVNGLVDGSIVVTGPATFGQLTSGRIEPHPVPATQRTELRQLIALRDTFTALIDAEASDAPDCDLDGLRQELNDAYDRYAVAHGPLNRVSTTTGKPHPSTGVTPVTRRFPRMGGFRADPSFPLVSALERFDDDTGVAVKSTIFDRRTIRPRQPVTGVATPADAIAVSLDQTGRIDIDRVAELLGTDADTARERVAPLVFRDPDTATLLAADDYLSGNVRIKLTAARTAHRNDPDANWARNVDALAGVIPVDLGPGQIDASFGAPWIPPADIADFIGEVVGIDGAIVHHDPLVAAWEIAVPSWHRSSVGATSTWGTSRKSAIDLIDAALNQRPVTVWDTLPDDRRVVNDTETMAARDKLEQLGARFRTWVWEDPGRADRLCHEYNERFNSIVLRRYDGTHLQLPGLADWFTPHQHQRDAVWRILCQGDTLLAHTVGAGKTATLVMGVMEQRRLGLITKPCFVVPNHMLEQFTREFLQLYPQANVLAANLGGTTAQSRRRFVAQCAAGDWDGIILPRESFRSIPVSRDTETAYLTRRVDELEDALSSNTGRPKVKELEKALQREKSRLQRLLNTAGRDDGIQFEQTGIDHLCVDECHTFKGKRIATRIPDVAGTESQRATDLDMKLTWLRSKNPGRVATFATGTPIANAISEMWVMQSYLQPDLLDTAGLAQFDAWAATFASTVTTMELKPSGDGYAQKTRFARYRNVPELLRLFHANADVRTADDLQLPVPTVVAGGETIAVPSTPELRAFVDTLVDRAEQVKNRRVEPRDDNMLKITGDGRKAALHLKLLKPPDPDNSPGPRLDLARLVDGDASRDELVAAVLNDSHTSHGATHATVGGATLAYGGKVDVCAERIAALYDEHKDRAYPIIGSNQPSPNTGALQIVFCDLGTPNTDGSWSVYQHLKDQLVAHGIPADQVRFIHEARNDREKAELFVAARDGRIAVLIGSTEKMGVGTNIQHRAIAAHHLDCPWRPSDLTQRDGRLVRQGNQNPDVHIIRYVTEGSFDVFMWATVTRKSKFLAQVMTSNPDAVAREIDDVGDEALTYAQVTAIATGNPLIVEQAELEQTINKLRRLHTAHENEQTLLRRRISTWTDDLDRLTDKIERLTAAEQHRTPTTGDKFEVRHTGGRATDTSRTEWGNWLRDTIINHATPYHRTNETIPAGQLGGLDITVHIPDQRTAHGAHITIEATRQRTTIDRTDALAADPVGLTRRIEHLLERIPHTIEDAQDLHTDTTRQHAAATERLDTPFPHTTELTDATTRLRTIEAALNPAVAAVGPAGLKPPLPESVGIGI